MFDHILVPLDGSSLAECALPHAVAIAQAYGARVTLMQVLESTRTISPVRFGNLLDWHFDEIEATAYLDGWVARLQEAGLCVESTVQEGSAVARITQFAQDHDVSLIVLNSHGRSGLNGHNIGGIAQKTVLHACVPVMIVRTYQPFTGTVTGLRYRRLLVPLDGSQRAECVLPVAITLARSCESHLLLAHVVRRPEIPYRVSLAQVETDLANQLVEHEHSRSMQYLDRLRSRLSPDVQTHLLSGDNASEKLQDLAAEENVDLVLLSAHGHGGGTRWPYGSVALSFISYGATPLLIVQDMAQDVLEKTQAEMAAVEHQGH